MIFVGIRTVILLLLFAAIILLQIFLSRRESRWPGLVLPALFFLFSLVAALNVAVLPGSTARETAAAMLTVGLLYNIPTLILLAIYFACREKFRRKKEMDRMSAQDLE